MFLFESEILKPVGKPVEVCPRHARPGPTWRENARGFPKTRSFLTAGLLFLCFAASAVGQSGVFREVYTNLIGSPLKNLTNDASFPNSPASIDIINDFFETPVNFADHYGQRLRGLIIPPLTGTYVFWIAADQTGALFLSNDESPNNKTQIAFLTNSVIFRAWYSRPTQQSTNIYLEAGRRYYIEALHASYNGSRDFLSIGWKLADGALEQPIPAARLVPFGMAATTAPIFTYQPANLTLLENSPASFRVGVSNLDVVTFQWQRNGATLPGGAGATYTIPSVSTNDNGASFRCILSNRFGRVTSASATLGVLPDHTPPILLTIANISSNTVEVLFSEPVDSAAATNLSSYSINNGPTIASVKFGTSTRAVILTTSPLTTGTDYTVTVSNVRDRAAARNIIAANSQKTFTALLKGIYREVFGNIPGSLVSDLTNDASFPNSPVSGELLQTVFEAQAPPFDNYGQRLRALLIPPLTGSYTFWVAANNTATLLLSSNELALAAQPFASVSLAAPVSPRQWDVQSNQKSALIPLVAGQRYYIEALMKAGVSVELPPDHLSVRWQLPDGTLEEPIPVSRLTPYGLTLPLIVLQPANTTVVEGQPVTFVVSVANLDPISYQWQQNGANIPGATNAIYINPIAQMGDSGSIFQCALGNVIGMANSLTATLTVTPDITPPALLNVINNGSNRVVAYFTEPVDSFTAGNAANYSITGVGISAPVVSADRRSVTLTTTPLTSGQAYTLTVNGVRDLAATPNTITPNSQWTFLAGDFFPQDIGSPAVAGSLNYNGNGLDVAASGSGTEGTSDQFNFTYQQRSGNFDVKVRVQRLDLADPWTTAGLMAREDLSTNSRFAAVFGTPSITGTFFQYRTNAGAPAQIAGSFPVNYPYTWLRLQRLGGTQFTGYASYDGQTWTQLGTVALQLPATIYLGFAVASHSSSETTVAQFRDFSDATGGTVGRLPVTTEPLGPSSRNTGLAFTEIMYHPGPRGDGLNLEFIELFNSNPFTEDISGYRISGDIDYKFPPGTILQGGAFLVIANNPWDIRAVYGIGNVTGPYSKHLLHSAGTVRLLNPAGAVFLEAKYDSLPPWPLAADGSGHSLVLARASYGEGDVRAWAQSDLIGGSPGRGDGFSWEPGRNVLINEFAAHSIPPDVDFVELYNHSALPVDISGCWLSDTPAVNKYRIPNGTIIGPTNFLYFTEPTLGFVLNAAGESIYFVSSNQTRVIDSRSFEPQENSVSMGRVPDGGPAFQRLAAKSPGAANGPIRSKNIVINEIMYHPISDDNNDQYVELYNSSATTINLSFWQFTSGISFMFPTNTLLAPNGYLVVAKNAAHLMTNYPNLNTNNTFGDFGGALSHGGERIALAMPDSRITTNNLGMWQTNIIYPVVDEVTYGTGGRWGKWSDAGGSSLELIDPHSDNRLPSNWADSDDTAKSTWTTITATGLLDNASTTPSRWNSLQLYMLDGPSECLVDNVDFRIPTISPNSLVANGGFESGLNGWTLQGDHRSSFVENSGDASSHSLHIVATDRGDLLADRIFTSTLASYTTGVVGTITGRVKWLHGWPEILFRLRGAHLEATGRLNVPQNLGTPGARNSRYATNAGPAITETVHTPVLPAANQPVVVTARVHDPDGIASVQLIYHLDGGASFTLPMVDNGAGGDSVPGDGVYSATIPGQAADALVAFYVQATDRFAPAATARFPHDAPGHECVVRFGDLQPNLSFGTYHLWLTQAALNKWLAYEKLSNEPYDATFVYGNFRVIYSAAAHYVSSPAHSLFFDSPIGTNCSYKFIMPGDEPFLGDSSMRVEQPGNGGVDATCLLEQIAYRIADQLNEPYNYFRSINLFVNASRRGIAMVDVTRESHGYDKEWYPQGDPGDLYKVGYWYEFDDDATQHGSTAASLLPFTTTGGVKKLARYRPSFSKRAVQTSANDYTNLFNLVDALNTTATGDAYLAQVAPVIDFTEWARTWAVERIINNTDLYGSVRKLGPIDRAGAQNCYIFKPAGDSWKFLIWDVQAGFAGLPTDDLFGFSDPPMTNLFAQPLMLRTYWQALDDAAHGPLMPEIMFPWIDARYNAFLLSGFKVAAPENFKNFISVRRDYILGLLAGVRTDFAITSNGGNSFTNSSTLVTLTGAAPISARDITINGILAPLSWSSITNWSVQLALSSQTNQFVIRGFDAHGNVLTNAIRNITIYFNGPVSRPEDSLVINEIMYNPSVTNGGYVEIYNRSTNTTFSLANFRLQGINFDFPPATIIRPQSFLMVVEDLAAFRSAYGSTLPIAGEFSGTLNRNGETLTLLKQAATPNEADVIIDKVKYESGPPWPARPAAANSGFALQLIDPAQDNARVSNWDVGAVPATPGKTNSVAGMLAPYPLLWINEVQPNNASGLLDNTGTPQPWIELFNSGTNSISLDGLFLSRTCTNVTQWAFPPGAVILPGQFRVIFADGQPQLSTGAVLHASFRLDPTNGCVVLSRGLQILDYLNYTNLSADLSYGSYPDGQLFDREVFYFVTPGASNNPAPVPIAINEWMASNTQTLQNPGHGNKYDDWFELYNFGTATINLSGYYLTDNFGNENMWRIPEGTIMAPRTFLLCWADNNTGTNTLGNALHVNFQLSKSGDKIGLYSPGLVKVDSVSFGTQTSDVSQGRFPDGDVKGPYHLMPAPTPRTNNIIPDDIDAPVLTPIPDYTINEGSLLNFTAHATDADLPAQVLTYYLLAGAPEGAIIDPSSGVFIWTPLEAQGGASYSITVSVTDNANPPLTTSRTFTVIVNKVNSPPLIGNMGDVTVDPGTKLNLTVPAIDFDLPPQTLTHALLSGPGGATVSPAGLFSWSPSQAHAPSTNLIVVTVTDNGVPTLSATQSFTIFVTPGASGLSFQSITPLENGQLKLVLLSPAGGNYHLQGSSDLVHWDKIDDLTIPPTGRLEYMVSGSLGQQFYRAVRY